MTTKTNKAKTVKTLLRRGLSTKQITNHMAVSPGYVWLLKKQMAEEKAEENDDNVVRPRYVSKHPPMMRRVTKEHAEHLMELNPKERAEQIKELDRERLAYLRYANATLTEPDYPEAKSELTNMSPEEYSELLYSLSNGKGKERVAPKVDKVDATLTERGEDYGNYANKAVFIQEVKYLMRSGPSWDTMDPDMRESMDMIAHKMGRIAYGDPSHLDSWIDIAGYAKLVSDRLQGNAR
jgi:hypothetical protein